MTTLFRTPEQITRALRPARAAGETIGLVPTMGYLHEGHLSLVRASRRENNRTVVSIFVNPTQFGPNEDLDRYPRDEQRDMELLEKEGVDFVFAPPPEAMYLPGHSVYVEETELSRGLCGASRPGHFRGVCTVVLKLFNIVRPDSAYFGEKDFQQFTIIRRMARDLNLPVEIRPCPIIREADGLALSSRNAYLSPGGREAALALSRSLRAARRRFEEGERDAAVLRRGILDLLAEEKGVLPEYAEVRDRETLEEISTLDRPAVIALAARVEGVRLIDNIQLEE
ncbi:MAG: pantoate--beta-alanine ligase [Synergistaceae bacterium]|nr:pantoate--beta-alanine ligase [Synergistaceae bacterium]